VVLNLTATDTTGSGFVAAFADGTAVPGVSNLNYTPGLTVANLTQVVSGVNGYGGVQFYNGGAEAGGTQLIVDLFGYYATS